MGGADYHDWLYDEESEFKKSRKVCGFWVFGSVLVLTFCLGIACCIFYFGSFGLRDAGGSSVADIAQSFAGRVEDGTELESVEKSLSRVWKKIMSGLPSIVSKGKDVTKNEKPIHKGHDSAIPDQQQRQLSEQEAVPEKNEKAPKQNGGVTEQKEGIFEVNPEDSRHEATDKSGELAVIPDETSSSSSWPSFFYRLPFCKLPKVILLTLSTVGAGGIWLYIDPNSLDQSIRFMTDPIYRIADRVVNGDSENHLSVPEECGRCVSKDESYHTLGEQCMCDGGLVVLDVVPGTLYVDRTGSEIDEFGLTISLVFDEKQATRQGFSDFSSFGRVDYVRLCYRKFQGHNWSGGKWICQKMKSQKKGDFLGSASDYHYARRGSKDYVTFHEFLATDHLSEVGSYEIRAKIKMLKGDHDDDGRKKKRDKGDNVIVTNIDTITILESSPSPVNVNQIRPIVTYEIFGSAGGCSFVSQISHYLGLFLTFSPFKFIFEILISMIGGLDFKMLLPIGRILGRKSFKQFMSLIRHETEDRFVIVSLLPTKSLKFHVLKESDIMCRDGKNVSGINDHDNDDKDDDKGDDNDDDDNDGDDNEDAIVLTQKHCYVELSLSSFNLFSAIPDDGKVAMIGGKTIPKAEAEKIEIRNHSKKTGKKQWDIHEKSLLWQFRVYGRDVSAVVYKGLFGFASWSLGNAAGVTFNLAFAYVSRVSRIALRAGFRFLFYGGMHALWHFLCSMSRTLWEIGETNWWVRLFFLAPFLAVIFVFVYGPYIVLLQITVFLFSLTMYLPLQLLFSYVLLPLLLHLIYITCVDTILILRKFLSLLDGIFAFYPVIHAASTTFELIKVMQYASLLLNPRILRLCIRSDTWGDETLIQHVSSAVSSVIGGLASDYHGKEDEGFFVKAWYVFESFLVLILRFAYWLLSVFSQTLSVLQGDSLSGKFIQIFDVILGIILVGVQYCMNIDSWPVLKQVYRIVSVVMAGFFTMLFYCLKMNTPLHAFEQHTSNFIVSIVRYFQYVILVNSFSKWSGEMKSYVGKKTSHFSIFFFGSNGRGSAPEKIGFFQSKLLDMISYISSFFVSKNEVEVSRKEVSKKHEIGSDPSVSKKQS